MKKTLTLLALTAALMPMIPLATKGATETYWVTGVTLSDQNDYSTAVGWYDAEKRWGKYSDGQLCWAATCSNLITWWQQQNAEFIPDRAPTELADVWNTYRLTFDNNGGDIGQGLHWWLDGDYGQGLQRELKPRKGDFVNGEATLEVEDGGFYKDSLSPLDTVQGRDLYTISPVGSTLQDMSASLVSAISKGYGVGLSWVTSSPLSTTGTMGHAVTVWGADYDSDSGLLTALYLTDSDDGKTGLEKVGILPNSAGNMFVKDGSANSAIESFTVLNSRLSNDINYYNYLDKESGNIILRQNVAGKGYTLTDGTQEVNDIIFDSSNGVQARLLTVEGEHTAQKLCVNGAGSNTLDVTAGSKLIVGQATGGNALIKTGAGSLEILQASENPAGSVLASLDVRQGDVLNHGSLGNVQVSGDGRLVNEGSAGALTLRDGGVAEMKSTAANKGSQFFSECVVADGGELTGTGTFGKVKVEQGGTLIVGNSPGLQSYNDQLIVVGGTLVFSIDDALSSWCSAASDTNNGWGSDMYSNIDMNGHSLTLNPDEIVFTLGARILERSAGANDLMDALGAPITVSLSNVYFIDDLNSMSDILNGAYASHLNELEQLTRFELSKDDEAIVSKGLQAVITPENIEYFVNGQSLVMNAKLNVMLSAAPAIPEPSTSTLSLLALASLCARRRRK